MIQPADMEVPTRASQRAHQLLQFAAMLSLLILGGVLHLHEIPEYESLWWNCCWAFLAFYPVMWLETIVLVARGCPFWKSHLAGCFVPPLRLIARHGTTGQFWLPGRGWFVADESARESLERAFSTPMIVIALLVLPLMGIEHLYETQILANPNYALMKESATSLIWAAFCVEFFVMFSVQEKRIKYCIRHWLEIVIILLPLVAFLRAVRLGRLMRLQKLTRTARVYRLRGALVRLQRAILLLNIVKRILHAKPEARLKSLRERLQEKEREIQGIRDEITELEAKVAQLSVVAPDDAAKAA